MKKNNMSKTTEFMFPKTMQLTPKHGDAMHLIKLFVKEYEDARWDSSVNNHKLVAKMSNVYDLCKNFGF